jgi:hypothetical protein
MSTLFKGNASRRCTTTYGYSSDQKEEIRGGTATDSAIDVEEYNYQPIRLKTLKQNLEAIPHETVRLILCIYPYLKE